MSVPVMDELPRALPGGLTSLSVSSISLLSKCPEKWRRRYLAREYEPPSGAMVLGSSAGAAEGQHYQTVIDTGTGLDVEQVLDCFSDEWEDRTGRTDVQYGADRPGVLKDAGAAALSVYHERVAPQVTPVSSERMFTVRFEGCDWTLNGYLDLEEADGAVSDLKMRARKPRPADARQDLQAAAYLFARRAEGNPAPEFRFHNMIRTASPSAYVEPTRRTDAQLDNFAARVIAAAAEINWRCEHDVWTGAPPGAWWCAQTTCGMWSACRFGGLA